MKTFLLSLFLLFPFFAFPQSEELGAELKQLIRGKQATVGVAVIFNGSELITINNIYRYPMLSTMKFHQALAVLDYVNRHGETLDKELLVSKDDLLPGTHSPMRDANPNGNFTITIGDLLKYSVIRSDNIASDILARHIGGQRAVNDYIHKLGIRDVSITATEAEMHEDVSNQYLNWTTPSAAALTIETFLQNNLFPEGYKLFLQRAMTESETGKDKLFAGLPKKNVLLAHKTGSSDRNEYGVKVGDNDMGFVVLPDGQYYTIAVFIMNSRETDEANARLMADISRAVYRFFEENHGKEAAD